MPKCNLDPLEIKIKLKHKYLPVFFFLIFAICYRFVICQPSSPTSYITTYNAIYIYTNKRYKQNLPGFDLTFQK